MPPRNASPTDEPESLDLQPEELGFVAPPLSAAELAEIDAKAREAVLKEQHDRMFKDALEAAKARAREAANLAADASHNEPMESLTIEIPLSVPYIATNNTRYYDGHTYRVRSSVAAELRSRMFLMNVNERRINGTWNDSNPRRGVNIGGLNAGAAISFRSGATSGHVPQIGSR